MGVKIIRLRVGKTEFKIIFPTVFVMFLNIINGINWNIEQIKMESIFHSGDLSLQIIFFNRCK